VTTRAAMPMFPLGTVVLPGAVVPLHVFEPRYRQLVVDCLASDDDPPVFGSVLIERGSEVGGGDQRAELGVIAAMHQVAALPDGRYQLLAVGTSRVRVVEWLDDRPYPRATVETWEDPDRDDPELVALLGPARRRVNDVLTLAQRLGAAVPPDPHAGTSDSPALASYQLGAVAPIGAADQYRLLAAPTVRQRFAELAEALDDAESMMRFRLG
jgi:Lon protease-like protein